MIEFEGRGLIAVVGVARYGYVYARVRARLADFLDAREIRALMDAVGWDEFVSTLMNTPYGAVAGGAADAIALERALKHALTAQYMMILRSVTDKRLHQFFHEFFRRLEVKNLKAIIRQKARREHAAETMYPVDDYFKRRMAMLAREEVSLDALVEHVDEPYKSVLSAHIPERHRDILLLERALDEEIFSALIERAKRLHADDRKIVSELIGIEADIANVMAFLRCKHEGSTDEMQNFLLPFAFSLPAEELRDAAFADDIPSAIRSLPDGIIKKNLEGAIQDYEAERSLLPFENALRKMFYEHVKRVMRGYPLNMGTIVGFLYLKEIEIHNICAIAVGKEYGIPVDEIMKFVIF